MPYYEEEYQDASNIYVWYLPQVVVIIIIIITIMWPHSEGLVISPCHPPPPPPLPKDR